MGMEGKESRQGIVTMIYSHVQSLHSEKEESRAFERGREKGVIPPLTPLEFRSSESLKALGMGSRTKVSTFLVALSLSLTM
eukprot:968963-Amorphochlora_amoeboformis.AAC.1